jgi:hypothetical protein
MVTLTIQGRAASLSQTAQLRIAIALSAKSGGTFTQVMSVPSHGVNSKGEIVQTTQVTGLFTPAVGSERVKIALREVNGKKIRSLVGVAQLVKVKLQVVNQADDSSNIVAKKPVVKKPVVKKPAPKK